MVTEAIKPGYKQTEVGVIPEDWEVDSIQNISSITTGSKNTQDKMDNEKYPFFVRSNKVERINTFSFDGEAVLTAGDGVGTGKVFHYIKGKFDFHQRVYKMSNFKENIDGHFFYLYFSNNFLERIMSMTAKSSVDSVRMEMIANMLIPIPTKKEQQAIAQALSDTDELIESLNKLILKKKDVKQGTMQLLLTGKKRLPGFSEEWEKKKIGEVLGYEQPVNYIVKSTEYANSNNTPVLTANKGFILGYTDETEGVYSKIPAIIFDDFTLDKKYVSFPFKVKSSAIKILTIKDGKSDLKFMYEKMQLVKIHIGDHKRYYISEYQEIEIDLPPPKEQIAIANVLLFMDEEIEVFEKERDKYNLIKSGMMQQLLTGSIRLKWQN